MSVISIASCNPSALALGPLESISTVTPTFPLSTTTNKIYDNSIASTQIFPAGRPIDPPMVQLYLDPVEIHFDDFSPNQRTLYYTVYHCDANWNPSDLTQMDYIQGFQENTIENVEYSFNTMVDYTHYTFSVPNEMMKITLSGNYVVYVFEDGDRSNPVLSQRFVMYERRVEVVGRAFQPNTISELRTGQEVDASIFFPSFQLTNPYDYLSITLAQNGRWDNVKHITEPTFVKSEEVVYNRDDQMTFDGGSEWRFFDSKDFRYVTPPVVNIFGSDSMYHIDLERQAPRTFDLYTTQPDLNGHFYVQNDRGQDSHVDADYANVSFSLAYEVPLRDEDVYVFGGLSNWQALETHKLNYNYETKAYQGDILLKQGYFNYQYAVVNRKTGAIDLSLLEGDHFETRNTYQIIVYHYDQILGYDRIIGFLAVESNE